MTKLVIAKETLPVGGAFVLGCVLFLVAVTSGCSQGDGPPSTVTLRGVDGSVRVQVGSKAAFSFRHPDGRWVSGGSSVLSSPQAMALHTMRKGDRFGVVAVVPKGVTLEPAMGSRLLARQRRRCGAWSCVSIQLVVVGDDHLALVVRRGPRERTIPLGSPPAGAGQLTTDRAP